MPPSGKVTLIGFLVLGRIGLGRFGVVSSRKWPVEPVSGAAVGCEFCNTGGPEVSEVLF